MNLRVGHISDLHYCMEHLTEVNRCTDAAVGEIIRRQCDVAVLSGDSTDHRLDLHSPAVSALLNQVHRLANSCPVLILHGTASHEPPGTLDVFKTIAGKFPVYVADRIKQVALVSGRWIESEDWFFKTIPADARALFSVLPSVDKGAVAAARGAEHAASATGELVYDLLKAWSIPNLAARLAGVPTIGVSHGTVSGSMTEHGVPMIGLDFEFTTGSLFAAECSAFFLGHIHQMQVWEHNGRRVAYPGSIGRLHFGEITDKGFLIWDVQPNGATTEFIVTPAKRLIQVEFKGPPDMEKLREIAWEAHGAHVRIRYELDEENRHLADKEAITALFAGAAACKIEGHINPIVRTRSEGMNRTHSLAEKLKKWGEVTTTDTEPLLERLSLLEHKDPDAIVAEVTQ